MCASVIAWTASRGSSAKRIAASAASHAAKFRRNASCSKRSRPTRKRNNWKPSSGIAAASSAILAAHAASSRCGLAISSSAASKRHTSRCSSPIARSSRNASSAPISAAPRENSFQSWQYASRMPPAPKRTAGWTRSSIANATTRSNNCTRRGCSERSINWPASKPARHSSSCVGSGWRTGRSMAGSTTATIAATGRKSFQIVKTARNSPLAAWIAAYSSPAATLAA
ncbi:MAG: hypothetical protein IPO58_12055 [Betaproteobacteria bacterium]|nr:hypothetical protein [Betaproteobacteria bacterium]